MSGYPNLRFLALSRWLITVALSVLPVASFAQWMNAGPLYDQFDLIFGEGERTEALGPLFYSQANGPEKTWALPPLFSRVSDPETDLDEMDFVYPIMTYNRFGSEFRWHLFQLLSFAGGQNQQGDEARRFTLFPIYFQQRSGEPDQNYIAVVPLYGHLRNRLLRDEIFFVMFPVYSQTRKRDVVTKNYLYPFFHLRRGNGLEGWQIWPLTGHEHKEITTRTNGFGDVETIAGHDRRFVLWPIYLRQESGLGTDNPQTQWAVLPLYSSLRSIQRDATTVLWPFFTHVDDRAKDYVEWQTPWPLVVFARGPGKQTSRIWPLFSHAESANLQSRFYLWPVYKFNRFHSEAVDRERTRILFFLYSDMIQKNVQTGAARRRVDFWPLFTHRRDYDGSRRLQVLSLLEPLLPNSTSIERNYSPVWALWRSENNSTSGAASQSLLWNLYRRETSPDARKCSLLFGLFQYQSDSDSRRWRLFYLPAITGGPAERATP